MFQPFLQKFSREIFSKGQHQISTMNCTYLYHSLLPGIILNSYPIKAHCAFLNPFFLPSFLPFFLPSFLSFPSFLPSFFLSYQCIHPPMRQISFLLLSSTCPHLPHPLSWQLFLPLAGLDFFSIDLIQRIRSYMKISCQKFFSHSASKGEKTRQKRGYRGQGTKGGGEDRGRRG